MKLFPLSDNKDTILPCFLCLSHTHTPQVNKEQAERCRDIAAEALRGQNYEKAVKMFQKSLQLYPLPGVEALLAQSKAKLNGSSSSSGNSPSVSEKENRQSTSNTGGSAADTNTSSSNNTGSNGRAFTEQQAQIVNKILKAKSGGSKAHYRVLELEESCNEGQIKKAYRKLSLKVHPDKNPHPQADEAFKAVGLAYATLSDSQKRAIYDRYGEEDPDNRGGGGAGMNNPFGGMHMRPGQEVSPEDIFNMFFHGAGGPGVHFRTGFGPGVHFRADPMNFHNFQRRGRAPDRPRGQEEQPNPVAILFQFLPIILIMLLSFIKFGDNMQPTTNMPGHDRYFSLTVRTALEQVFSFRSLSLIPLCSKSRPL